MKLKTHLSAGAYLRDGSRICERGKVDCRFWVRVEFFAVRVIVFIKQNALRSCP